MFEPSFFHWYVNPLPVLALNTTDDPSQNVVGPPAVTLAVGKAFTTIAIVAVFAHCAVPGVKV